MRGVYAIKCADRAYVGGSVRISYRWAHHRHLLRHGRHDNKALQAAWSELGEPAFSFVVLELVPEGDLIGAEQRWIDQLRAGCSLFNRSPTAGSPTGVVHTPETRARVGAASTARWSNPAARAHLSAVMKGRQAGERHGRAKLTDAKVLEIRRLSSEGVSGQRLAAIHGVSQATISSIVLGQAWRHLLPFEEATQPEQKEAA